MIPDPKFNIWAHTQKSLFPLYARRAAGEGAELDCHAQAAELYEPFHRPGDRILDAGAGSGYFYWSLKKRNLLGAYFALDYTQDFIEMGRDILRGELPPERFIQASIQEAAGRYEAVFCLNTLFALPDYREGLDRLLKAATKVFILRTTLGSEAVMRYETDEYLDPEACDLKSYFNIWPLDEVKAFIASYGFEVEAVVDRRTGDRPEISAGKIFPWRFLRAVRTHPG